jgi:hypothetical protein
MADETAVVEEKKPFDFLAYKAASSEGKQYTPEAAAAEPVKPAEPEKPKVAAAEPHEDDEPEEGHKLPRSVRRQMRKSDMELGAAKEREAQLQRQIDALMAGQGAPKTTAKTEADPEPQRAQFGTDAEYNRALGRWDARQEAKAEVSKVTAKADEEQQNEQYLSVVRQMDEKAAADQKALPDWDAAVEAATALGDELAVPPGSALERLLQISDERARVLYHFAKNPEDFRKLKAMGDGPILIRDFGRLESRVEKLYPATTKEEPKKEAVKEPERPTAAERDAKKPKPSEAVTAKGGASAPALIPMLLEDGKTLNPAWKAQRNAENGVRP